MVLGCKSCKTKKLIILFYFFSLPDLGLCLTPEKQTLQNEHTNASNRLSTDDWNTDIPLRKKRRLWITKGLCHTQHILL